MATLPYPSEPYHEPNKSNTVSELGLIALVIAILLVGGYFGFKYIQKKKNDNGGI